MAQPHPIPHFRRHIEDIPERVKFEPIEILVYLSFE